jgi:hypothetical protein
MAGISPLTQRAAQRNFLCISVADAAMKRSCITIQDGMTNLAGRRLQRAVKERTLSSVMR